MPKIHLFVVSIESLQQQGIELTEEVEKVIPSLIDKIKNLLAFIEQEDVKNELVLAD
jgi:hydrogenase maturation protease